ncbi:MAG: DUF2971 domain-containing protein [Ruminococcus flavefaciens]|nr:DUF2971 domain-containing protein [Ruminococcus flavefaciens]
MSNNTVYHYCSVETFYKIITNKELWLTDVTKSNDSKELELVFDNLTEVLDKRTNFLNEIRDDFVPLRLFKLFLDEFKKIEQLFHICCFSIDSDSLSQWAMYANDATGIAIGFDRKFFQNLKNNSENIDFDKVNYSLKIFLETVNQKLDKLCAMYKKMGKNDYSWYLEFMNFVINEITRMAYLYKNQSFKQEHEYRLVYNSKPCVCNEISDDKPSITQTFTPKEINVSTDIKIGEINYYVSRGRLVSYRPFQINNIGSIINKIVIGPKSRVSIHDLEMILISNGIDLSIHKINLSNSTYR